MTHQKTKIAYVLTETIEFYYDYEEIQMSVLVATAYHQTKKVYFDMCRLNDKAFHEVRRSIEKSGDFKNYRIIG